MTDTTWVPDLDALPDRRPKYDRLAAAIRAGIAGGDLVPGQKLPPVRDLAWKVGVTPGTAARAYRLLTDAGVLTAGVGRGTYVAETKSQPSPVLLAEHVFDASGDVNLFSPKMPDLGQGHLIATLAAQVVAQMPADRLMRYPSRVTDLAARQACLAGLHADVGPAEVEDIVATNGGQNAIVLILQTILRGPAPVILGDAISYNGFRSAAEMCRAELLAVPWDDDGPDPQVFENLVRQHGAQVYCTASEVNNPTGQATSVARRQQIAAIARAHGVHVIDDDCYARINRVGPSYRALLPDLGWHVASPSKTISPALRIGFAVAPKAHAAALVRSAIGQSFGVSPLLTDLYAALMRSPEIDGIVQAVRARIDRDVGVVVTTFADCAPGYAPGIPFVWLVLPRTWRANDFVAAAKARGIHLKSSESFLHRDSRMVHAVRIAVNGLLAPDRFDAAIADLRDLMDTPAARISV
ncbi:PLP-dependent aminotransferase family protein [Loktanella sp. 3ANDIMAR09]|uniref:aminotransferase-like domain-containing protein n=1 Tax=Loktanella sp. 3ANDIMAR09 TaxID=1225657 RepID=UPI000A67D782|nr:PLP-dependent aminotransferase family protein [Loktanella sp. 3ANDIMAR09]